MDRNERREYMTPEDAERKAGHAKQLLEDPLLKESFDLAHTAIQQALRVAKTPEESFKATIALQTFFLIKDSISTHIETGKIISYNFKPTLREKIGL
jgi:D-hexose-6-phosphate mutarotase